MDKFIYNNLFCNYCQKNGHIIDNCNNNPPIQLLGLDNNSYKILIRFYYQVRP